MPAIRPFHRHLLSPILAVLLVVSGLVLAAGPQESVTDLQASAVPQPTDAELREWEAIAENPAARAEIIEKLQTAFAGVAKVSFDPPADASRVVESTAEVNDLSSAQPILAFGGNRTKFWVTASYYDITVVGLAAAAAGCAAVGVPAWICASAFTIMGQWAGGSRLQNHGVWVEISWRPPFVRGGRW